MMVEDFISLSECPKAAKLTPLPSCVKLQNCRAQGPVPGCTSACLIQLLHAAAQLPFSLRETVAARSNGYLA